MRTYVVLVSSFVKTIIHPSVSTEIAITTKYTNAPIKQQKVFSE